MVMQSLMARLSGPDVLAFPVYEVSVSGARPFLFGRSCRWCWRGDRAEASENDTVLYPTPVVFLDRVQFKTGRLDRACLPTCRCESRPGRNLCVRFLLGRNVSIGRVNGAGSVET